MRWRVEVSDITDNHRLLRETLSELSIVLLEENDGFFLVSDQFEALDTPQEVHILATRVRSIIEEPAKGIPEIQLGLKIGSVTEETTGGRRKHYFIFASSGPHKTIGERCNPQSGTCSTAI